MFSCGLRGNPINACCPCRYFSSIGNSVSRWCSHGCEDDFPCFPGVLPVYAYLTQLDPFTIAAGEPIPFTGPALFADGVRFLNGVVTLPRAGVYRVESTLRISNVNTVDTDVFIEVAGVPIAGTLRHIVSPLLGGDTQTVHVSAIFEAGEGVSVALVSSNDLSLIPVVPGDPIATMNIVEIG